MPAKLVRLALVALVVLKIDASARRTIGHRNCQADKACHAQVDQTYQDEIREIDTRITQLIATRRTPLLEISEMEREWKAYGRLQREQRNRDGVKPNP